MESNPEQKEEHIEDFDLPSALRSYQAEGVAFLANNESALLADEMGLGKTVQTAVALRAILRREEDPKVLIICLLLCVITGD